MLSLEALGEKAEAYIDYRSNQSPVYSTSHLFAIELVSGMSEIEKNIFWDIVENLTTALDA